MNKRTIGLTLLFVAAILATIGALGNTFTSLPAMREHFSYEKDPYWFNRLTASLILGTVGLYFNAVIKWVGAFLAIYKDKGAIPLLLLSILPNISSIISLFLLTPQDWAHAIIHIIVVVVTPLGLFLVNKK